MFKEVTLPSGAVLKLKAASFAESKALYQAILEEAKDVDVGSNVEIRMLIKNVLFTAFSSKKIEGCLWACMGKCLYGSLKIDKDTFEPEAAREDYTEVCIQVAEENIRPFAKGLFAASLKLLATIESFQASRPETTPS